MAHITQDDHVVGIDIGKSHLDIHLHPQGKHWRVDYTPAGISQLAIKLAALEPQLVVMEASGGYERACADSLAAAGLAVAIVNPRLVRRFAGSFGKLAKTDKIDAEVITRSGHASPSPESSSSSSILLQNKSSSPLDPNTIAVEACPERLQGSRRGLSFLLSDLQ